jgi:histidine phosphotransferase ChpT
MTASQRDLTALIGSRICHDLISPLGAIGNGVELLAMSGTVAGPEMSLIAESVDNANARIRFFRIAFGAGGEGQMTSRREIAKIITDLTAGGRTRINWDADGDLPRQEVKLAFLLMQCFETAMPWGGDVTVTREDGAWTITGEAKRMKLDPALWEVLSNPNASHEVVASEVHFALAPIEAASQQRSLAVQAEELKATISF